MAIGTFRPSEFRTSRKFLTILITLGRGRVGGHQIVVVKVHAQAPISASRLTAVTGSRVGQTKSPNGSRPRFPTVQSPNVNLSAGVGRELLSERHQDRRTVGG